MVPADPLFWSDLLRRTLACYDEPLLRRVAARLVRPRNTWPADDLIDRAVQTAANTAVLDRRLKDLDAPARQLLALIGHSRQPFWAMGNLVELLFLLGHEDGVKPLFALLEEGLLYPAVVNPQAPDAPPTRIKSFEQWLGFPGPAGLTLFTHPLIAARALGEDLGLTGLTPLMLDGGPGHESDGLEWPLRLAVLWHQVTQAPLRRTQQGTYFKRDYERLEADPLLTAPAPDQLGELPAPGFLAAELARGEGVLVGADGELRAGDLPAVWDQGLAPTLASLWTTLLRVEAWNPLDGWRGGAEAGPGNPFPSAYLVSLLLLARLPGGSWADPAEVHETLLARHPYWRNESLRPSRQRDWTAVFLLGVAYPLRLVRAARGPEGNWLVSLSDLGRWLLGLGEQPAVEPPYTQTLLVQPNLEILAYRQGLTTGLLAKLTQFAAWKNLGAACTLQLGPETVYRALERGVTFDDIRRTLEQHGSRALPPAVLDSLRTWSNKRDRITVYAAATLLEFATADDLNEALARGLAAVRVADTTALVVGEGGIDFRHYRLTGARDYTLPPERCVAVEADGVTVRIDPAKSDLLLETELPRFAEVVDRGAADGRRLYRFTPASLRAAREGGLRPAALEAWFQQRAGVAAPAPVRLLLTAGQGEPPRLGRFLVLRVAGPEVADGLQQWPETRGLIADRLGPTALVVEEARVEALRERLLAAGIELTFDAG